MPRSNGHEKGGQVHVRLQSKEYSDLVKTAKANSRSANKQVEFYIRQGLERDRQKA